MRSPSTRKTRNKQRLREIEGDREKVEVVGDGYDSVCVSVFLSELSSLEICSQLISCAVQRNAEWQMTSCIRPVTRAKQIAFHAASRSLFLRTLCSFSSTFRWFLFFFLGGEIALSCIESKRRRRCERRQDRTGTTW